MTSGVISVQATELPSREIETSRALFYTKPDRRRIVRSPMGDVLHAISAVELLAPEDVPTAPALAERLTPKLRKACLAVLAAPTPRPTAALAALTRAMAKDAPKPWQDLRFMIDTGQTADDGTHDHFFRVRRSGHRDPLAYVRGLLLALDRLTLDVCETPTTRPAIAALGDGLLAALAAAIEAPPPAGGFAPPLAAAPARTDFAKWRWIRGHQIFAALTQGLIFAIEALVEADRQDAAALRATAELLSKLLLASAAGLEFTGDFPAETYRDSIRASMEAPHQPKGFSGILSADHRRFVSQMRAARPAIERLKSADPAAHSELVAGLAQVYDSHKFVCARFVGTDEASLLMAADCSRSAVEQIDRFKQMRLRIVQ